MYKKCPIYAEAGWEMHAEVLVEPLASTSEDCALFGNAQRLPETLRTTLNV
jgi:hypothetical protein